MITIRLFALGAVLFALNAWVAWRLFFVEYDAAMGSLAGIYIAIARRIATDGLHLNWWPLWFAGMPFQNVYQPDFHATVAAIFNGNLKPEQLISVQMAYHAGWRAEANGSTRPVYADAFGFIVIEPHCTTACTVRLIFDGGTELLAMRVLRWFAITVIVLVVMRRPLYQVFTNRMPAR